MCTMIALTAAVNGLAKGPDGWFPLTAVTVGYDHSTHTQEHSVLLDFTNYDIGIDARVAVELDLESGRALLAQLREAVALAERADSA
jgi:hypothetical protein